MSRRTNGIAQRTFIIPPPASGGFASLSQFALLPRSVTAVNWADPENSPGAPVSFATDGWGFATGAVMLSLSESNPPTPDRRARPTSPFIPGCAPRSAFSAMVGNARDGHSVTAGWPI